MCHHKLHSVAQYRVAQALPLWLPHGSQNMHASFTHVSVAAFVLFLSLGDSFGSFICAFVVC